MTNPDAIRLLALCAVFDNRKPDMSGIVASEWANALDDLEYDDCAEAIRRHYRETDRYIMIAHIRELAKAIRGERQAAEYRRRQFDRPALPSGGSGDGVPMPGYVKQMWQDFVNRRKLPEEEPTR